MTDSIVLTDFRSVSPAHSMAQADSLAWLADAHTQAEMTRARAAGDTVDPAAFRARIGRHLARFGCGADKIATRGHEIGDCAHTRWDEMDVYRLAARAEGEGMLERTRLFDERARGIVARLYAEEAVARSDLVHVTCTGYVSPSAAQVLVTNKGWGDATRVTHAYHMGCYAAFPAVRIASGLALAGDAVRARGPRRADVVHTEMCSLHMNPLRHDPEQLVVQSLFADGFIRYSVCAQSDDARRAPALTLLAQNEVLVPDSSSAMSWICSSWGMQMTLARDVPERLVGGLRAFVSDLCKTAGLDESDRARAVFAIHPGGPKILDRVRDVLAIDEAQIATSRSVLRERGNMSSATVPHIWMKIAHAHEIEEGRAIVSLAFGPGLTLCGTIMRKGRS